jgi:hypothetical protein
VTTYNTPITDGTVTWYFIAGTGLHLMSIISANSNYVAYNDFSGPSSVGIFVAFGDGNILHGNAVGQIIGLGIQLAADATNTNITSNVIVGIVTAAGNGIVDTNASATGTTIAYNVVNGSGSAGIFIQSPFTKVVNNTVTGACNITSGAAIVAAAGTLQFVITGNMVKQSTGITYGVQVQTGASDFYIISQNLVASTTGVSDGGSGTNKSVAANIGAPPKAGVPGIPQRSSASSRTPSGALRTTGAM